MNFKSGGGSRPYTTLNGVIPDDKLNVVLNQYSAQGN